MPANHATAARRQAHLIDPVLRALRVLRDTWTVAGVIFLITAACNAALSLVGVTP